MEKSESSGETFMKLLNENFDHFLLWWSGGQNRIVDM